MKSTILETKLYSLCVVSCFLIFSVSCTTEKKKNEKDGPNSNSIIEITTVAMDFQSVDTINSGWNTFKYINKSSETHFFLLDKYPEGKTVENTIEDIAPVFEDGMDLINQGKSEEGFAEFQKLPEWFFSVVFTGGSGLVSPNKSSIITIHLEPGYYIMECYVKMANGKFHTSMGMAKPIIVTSKKTAHKPPTPTVNLSISSTEGIKIKDKISTGEQIFSVLFEDQITHEHFVGHDVNLVRLDANADLESLEKWMNWSDPKGLISPAPDGVTFLGGVNDSPAGAIGYFKVNLEKGNYALISEVPNSMSKKMFQTFKITD